jgi:hypothetical protein
LTSTKWLLLYPEIKLRNLITSHFDHNPILLQNDLTIQNGRSYSFRYENIWLKEEDVGELGKWWRIVEMMEAKWKLLTESHIALTNCKIGGEEKECVSKL